MPVWLDNIAMLDNCVVLPVAVDVHERMSEFIWDDVTEPVADGDRVNDELWVIDCVTLREPDWLAVPNTTDAEVVPSCDIQVIVPEKYDWLSRRQATLAVPPFCGPGCCVVVHDEVPSQANMGGTCKASCTVDYAMNERT